MSESTTLSFSGAQSPPIAYRLFMAELSSFDTKTAWPTKPRIFTAAAAAAKSLQSCPTLCDPIDGSPTGSSVPGILQARTLEWVAICFSNVWKWKVKVKSLSRVWLFATPWTAAYQAPPSMGFARQEDWSGVPLPSPRIFTIRPLWTSLLIPGLDLGGMKMMQTLQNSAPLGFQGCP